MICFAKGCGRPADKCCAYCKERVAYCSDECRMASHETHMRTCLMPNALSTNEAQKHLFRVREIACLGIEKLLVKLSMPSAANWWAATLWDHHCKTHGGYGILVMHIASPSALPLYTAKDNLNLMGETLALTADFVPESAMRMAEQKDLCKMVDMLVPEKEILVSVKVPCAATFEFDATGAMAVPRGKTEPTPLPILTFLEMTGPATQLKGLARRKAYRELALMEINQRSVMPADRAKVVEMLEAYVLGVASRGTIAVTSVAVDPTLFTRNVLVIDPPKE